MGIWTLGTELGGRLGGGHGPACTQVIRAASHEWTHNGLEHDLGTSLIIRVDATRLLSLPLDELLSLCLKFADVFLDLNLLVFDLLDHVPGVSTDGEELRVCLLIDLLGVHILLNSLGIFFKIFNLEAIKCIKTVFIIVFLVTFFSRAFGGIQSSILLVHSSLCFGSFLLFLSLCLGCLLLFVYHEASRVESSPERLEFEGLHQLT